jgi:hypothetical protein
MNADLYLFKPALSYFGVLGIEGILEEKRIK